jgi:predicted nucleic acid-binding protein
VTVIDASVLAAFVLREEGWEAAELILSESPSSVKLLPAEVANAVLAAHRTRRLNSTEAHAAVQRTHRLCETSVSLFSLAPLLPDAWSIAVRQSLTIYDAMYLSLARRERVALASRDAAQLRGARELGIRVFAP